MLSEPLRGLNLLGHLELPALVLIQRYNTTYKSITRIELVISRQIGKIFKNQL
jgi:hypothetical protein